MAEISPTQAIHYTIGAGDFSHLLAPPYDVIDEEEAQRLRDLSPYNAVRLVLPEAPAPERYDLAAERLRDWLAAGILARAPHDSAYAYRQEFEHRGRRVVRRALLAAVQVTEFDRGEVLPHERTHRGPKEDRLALMKACEAQLSPIFMVAQDADRALAGLLREADAVDPILQATTGDGIVHAVREIPAAYRANVLGAASAGPLLIADGHHRYETALELSRQMPDRPGARRVLASIVSQHDEGLMVQATHRRIAGLPSGWLSQLEESFEVEREAEEPLALAERVRDSRGTAIGVVGGAADHRQAFILRPRAGAAELAGLSPAESALACVLLDRFILRRFTGADADAAARSGLLSYHQEPLDAAEPAAATAGFLLPPVSMPSLWEVVRHGVRLPPKSTYFAPKIPSGLLFRPI